MLCTRRGSRKKKAWPKNLNHITHAQKESTTTELSKPELVGHKVIADFYFYEKVNSFKKEFKKN